MRVFKHLGHFLGFTLAAAALAPGAALANTSEPCPSFEVSGEGTDVILVPGLGSSPQVWDRLVEDLSGSYRFHRVAVPGFAGEPPLAAENKNVPGALSELIWRYIECRDLSAPAIIGHSMGGFTALLVARDNPQTISAVVVVDALPFYPLIFNPDAKPGDMAERARSMASMIEQMDPASFKAMQERGAASLTKTEGAAATIVAWSLNSDRSTFARAIENLMTTDLRPDLPAIGTPVTVLYATNAFATGDRMGPLYTSAYAGLPKVTLVEIPDSYHFTMFDQPELTRDAIVTALSQD